MLDDLLLNTDGACKGNPGPMGIGGVLRNKITGETVTTISEPTGNGTNNEAEYLAVIRGLEIAKQYQPKSLAVRSDSQLIVHQMDGSYAIRQEHLRALWTKAQRAVKALGCPVVFEWIRREQNSEADALASSAAGMPMAKVSEDGKMQPWQLDSGFVVDRTELIKLPEIHGVCQKQINHIHKLNAKAKFANFVALKTGGLDPYSRMKAEDLQHAIEVRFGPSAWQWVMDTFGEEPNEYATKVIRWVARGLRPDLAAKKVSVDYEMAANALQNQQR